MLNGREQLDVGATQAREKLGVRSIGLRIAFRYRLDSPWIRDRHLVPQFLEQLAHPPRMRPYLDDHMGAVPSEEQLHRHPRCPDPVLLRSPVCPQHEDCGHLVAEVASDRLDGMILHGRSLLWTSSPLNTRILAG